jgi:hypothetical protein
VQLLGLVLGRGSHRRWLRGRSSSRREVGRQELQRFEAEAYCGNAAGCDDGCTDAAAAADCYQLPATTGCCCCSWLWPPPHTCACAERFPNSSRTSLSLWKSTSDRVAAHVGRERR